MWSHLPVNQNQSSTLLSIPHRYDRFHSHRLQNRVAACEAVFPGLHRVRQVEFLLVLNNEGTPPDALATTITVAPRMSSFSLYPG